MYKRLALSLAMLAVGAAMLAASGIASTGSAHKQSGPASSVAKKGGILKASLFAGIENIDPQRDEILLGLLELRTKRSENGVPRKVAAE